MNLEVTVSNYRCFSDSPIRFAVKPGLQAFVGINNSGKSCMLRLFYELRNVFAALSNPGTVWQVISNPAHQNFSLMPLVKDHDEMFHDRNDRDIIVGFDIGGVVADGVPAPTRFEIVLPRNEQSWVLTVYTESGPFSAAGLNVKMQGKN